MKKLTFIIIGLFLILPSLSSAQTTKGSFIAGGNVSLDFQNEKFENDISSGDIGNTTIIEFNPTVGYFFIDRLAAGISANISNTKFKSDEATFEDTSTSFLVGPFVKYYHKSNVFGVAQLGLGTDKFESESTGFETFEVERNVFDWRVGVGYAIFFNDYISLEPMFLYNRKRGKEENNFSSTETTRTINSFKFSVGFSIFL